MDMAVFEITTARHFLQKLHDEQSDFANSQSQSSRHALNAVITAYHLHEWVWEARNARQDLQQAWPYKCAKQFRQDHLNHLCPHIDVARTLANGTKHVRLKNGVSTGKRRPVFQPNVFQPNVFDVGHLWVEHNGKRERADFFISELVNFWDGFFAQYNL
jgi:hypothetical protein